jgi:hypothetical protein
MIAHIVLLGTTLFSAPADSTHVLRAHRLDAAREVITLDGAFREAAWEDAAVASGFVQMTPNPGAPATYPTEVRVLYGEDAVYVGMRMYDPHPDSIAAHLGRRDASGIYSDWAHVLIDSYNDNRTAFRFSANPRGVKKDVFHFDDTNEDLSWDAVWEVETQIDSLGWTAEFRIPFSQLRFNAEEGGAQVWGINFGREIARYDERAYWAKVIPSAGRFVSFAGELTGLRGLKSPRRLELQPYSVARVTRAPGDPDNPFYNATEPAASFGADLEYGLTSNLTLTATVNPDFGQVEADPSEVNLSAFESRFPERRPFFVEGIDIFSYPVAPGFGGDELFYSRRIGRSPQRFIRVRDAYVDAPDATTILGAAKLSGKVGDGWSVGLLNAVTAREVAQVSVAGADTTMPVEPLANYAIARVRKDFREGKSSLGGIFTATNRWLEEGGELDFLRSAAYTGGIDLQHRFGNYELSSRLVGSHIQGSTESISLAQRSPARYFQRPDVEHVVFDSTRTSLSGVSANALLVKIGGGNWRWGGGLALRTPGFEVNDLGYQRDADQVGGGGFLGYEQFEPGPVFQRWNIGFNPSSIWNLGGDRVDTSVGVNGSFQLRSFWGGYGGIRRGFETVSTTALRGGPAILEPGGVNAYFGFYSDRRKPVSVSLNGGASMEDETEGYSWRLGPELEWRPSSRAELSIEPSLSHNLDAWQYIGGVRSLNDEPHYVFGQLDQTTAALAARLNYAFTPELTLQLYAQPFISAGDYSEFREVANPRADTFRDRLPALGAEEIRACDGFYGVRAEASGCEEDARFAFRFGDPDFSFRQFRSNAVLRWQYRPGSTLFVVWSQGRTAYVPGGAFDLWGDTADLFGAPGTNVLLIKLNYWLDI